MIKMADKLSTACRGSHSWIDFKTGISQPIGRVLKQRTRWKPFTKILTGEKSRDKLPFNFFPTSLAASIKSAMLLNFQICTVRTVFPISAI
jgi:endonuclease III-like uncharacterized protein